MLYACTVPSTVGLEIGGGQLPGTKSQPLLLTCVSLFTHHWEISWMRLCSILACKQLSPVWNLNAPQTLMNVLSYQLCVTEYVIFQLKLAPGKMLNLFKLQALSPANYVKKNGFALGQWYFLHLVILQLACSHFRISNC